MSQQVVLQKPYDCLSCHAQIRLAKIDGAGPEAKKRWNKLELDGVTPHTCNKKAQPEEKEEQKQQSEDLSKTVSEIKAQLQVMVTKLETLERELEKK
jgi:hypothetical protein